MALLASGHGRLFAVGDDLQAIYGWRGADVTHIRRFHRDHPAAPPPLKLETNYRSTAAILRAANAVAARDPEAQPKILHPADPKAPAGSTVSLRVAGSPEAEGRLVVGWAVGLRKLHRDLPWRECAVLVRSGFVAKPILVALHEAGIPALLVREQEPEPPRDLLASIAWLRLAMSRRTGGRAGAAETWDRAADDAFRRACAYPTGGVGGALFQRLRDHATERGVALAAAVATLPAEERERAALNGVLGCARQIGTRIEAAGLGPDAALRLAATASGSAEPPAAQAMDRRSLAWASAFVAAEQAGSVAAYCDAAALDEAMAEGAVPEAVQVMTLHRAKGLEFDHVLLAGLEEGVWPHWQADAHGTEAEERRLFYVGLTRARKSVRLTWVRKRRDWPAKPSRFLAEIPDALLDHGAAPRHPPAPTHARTAAPRPIEPPSKAETERLVAEWRARKGVR